MTRYFYTSFLFLFISFSLMAETKSDKQYRYESSPQPFAKSVKLVSILYVANWMGYYLTQPDEVREEGSFHKYADNFGELHFDKDAPYWNLMVHPITGSQLYLFYRSQGYDNMNAFLMTLIQSSLFEFTIEIYTEPASIQDFYQTPVLGSILGFGIEHLSMKMLNNGTTWGKIAGHIINPWTIFNFSGIKTTVVPNIKNNKPIGLSLIMEY